MDEFWKNNFYHTLCYADHKGIFREEGAEEKRIYSIHPDRNSSITEQVGCLSARSMKYFHIKLQIRILGISEFPNYCKNVRHWNFY